MLLAVIVGIAVASVSACAVEAGSGAPRAPSPTRAARSAPAPVNPVVLRRPVRLGIDVDFYSWPGLDVRAVARADIAYIQHLHANAISISFPFFMHGPGSSRVYVTSSTPSPCTLALVAKLAERAGLYVTIRPLLDERSLGIPRVHWMPVDVGRWFRSYERFLLPYAHMAQAVHIPALVTGVEFSKFGSSPHWAELDAALRRVYSGTLSYSANWGRKVTPHKLSAGGVEQTIDTYRPLPLHSDATLVEVQDAWDAYGRTLPRGIVLSEVGIAAERGAYGAPYRVTWAKARLLDPAIQVRWFTAACRAVATDHFGGIYFWSLNFGQSLTAPPTRGDPASFVGGPGEKAISTCFEYLSYGPE